MNSSSLDDIKKHLSKDPKLKKIVSKLEPLQLEASGNVYRELVKNIVYQQISYKAADSIYTRFLNLIANKNFKPAHIIKHDIESLRTAGLSRQKANYILNISEYFIENKLYDHDWTQNTDEEIIKMLTDIKGVGVWTAKMILIFELLRPDVLAHEDLAIQMVMRELYSLKQTKKEFIQEITKIGDAWRPFRTAAGLYLWAYRRSQLEK